MALAYPLMRLVVFYNNGEAIEMEQQLIQFILSAYPSVQAIYLFGSWGTRHERLESDLDVAVLLPPAQAKKIDFWHWQTLTQQIVKQLSKPVDLINLRRVSTVLQKEIIMADRRIECADEYAADEFEALTLSFYQQLNQERREIVKDFWLTGRAYAL